MISAKRGVQWNRWKIRVLERVGGSMENKRMASDRYHYNRGKERIPMG
jgi:hypothetical protein